MKDFSTKGFSAELFEKTSLCKSSKFCIAVYRGISFAFSSSIIDEFDT